MYTPGYWNIVAVILSTCCVGILSKTISWKEESELLTVRCHCKVEADNGTLEHDYGIIKEYKWDEHSCHEVRHLCRQECDLHIDLEKRVEVEELSKSVSIGFNMCRTYGTATPRGGLEVVGVSQALECAHAHKDKISKPHHQLCCGNTYKMKKQRVNGFEENIWTRTLGWNPDCKTITYHMD